MEGPDPLTVLLVEDESDLRLVARLALQRTRAFTVVEADAAAAVARAVAIRPDVVLLDVMMPEMDGPEVLRALADNPATAAIPVIFLTAKATTDDLAHLGSLGAAGIITKPFDATRLADDVRLILERRAAAPPSTPMSPAARAVNEAALRKLDGLVGEQGRDIRLDLYDLFAARTPDTVRQLQAAAASGAGVQNETARLAHSLKSAAATLGLDAMAELCAELEAHLAAGRVTETRLLVDRLAAQVEPALVQLHAACVRLAADDLTRPGKMS